MTQYIISYPCETKQKVVSTLHGKKIVHICGHRAAAQDCGEGLVR